MRCSSSCLCMMGKEGSKLHKEPSMDSPLFINKALLEHHHSHPFIYYWWLFCTKAKLSSWHRECMSLKVRNIFYLDLEGKHLLMPIRNQEWPLFHTMSSGHGIIISLSWKEKKSSSQAVGRVWESLSCCSKTGSTEMAMVALPPEHSERWPSDHSRIFRDQERG